MVISVSSCFEIYSDIHNGTLQITRAAMSEREFVLRRIAVFFHIREDSQMYRHQLVSI